MRFNENYIAVGVTANDLGKFTMDEHMARKVADDILRNANYLWPDQSDADLMREFLERRSKDAP
jgi:hypothetical protein